MRKHFLLALLWLPVIVVAQDDTTATVYKFLDDVTVLARVTQPTDNYSDLDKEEINQTNFGQNLPYLLQSTPSLVVTSDDGLGVGYTYFRVRGTDHTRINMTVNDVPLNDQESQTVFWVNMTDMASSLSQLIVQRGVGSSVNGSSAFGASVNMTTDGFKYSQAERAASLRKPAEVTLQFNGGMYNTFREMVNADVLLPKNFRFQARLSKVNSDGYLERAKSDLFSYYANIGYYGERRSVNLMAFGGKEKTYMAWDGVTADQMALNPRYNPAGLYVNADGEEVYYPNQTDNYWQQHFQLHYSERFNNYLTWNNTLHYTHGGGYYEQMKADKKYSDFGQSGFYTDDDVFVKRSNFVRQKHLNNHFYGLVTALNLRTEPVDAMISGAVNNYNGHHWGQVWDDLYKTFDNVEYYRNTGDKLDANVYAKVAWRAVNQAARRLTIFGDLQYRFVDYRIDGINDEDLAPIPIHEKFNFFNPKAGVTYYDHNHQVYFNFAVANREPSRKNYTEAGVNDVPRPEHLRNYELGYQYADNRFHVGINLYYMKYKNQLVLTGKYSDTGAYLTRNVDNSYRTGAEFSVGVNMIKWFRWEANLTLSRNKIIDYTDWIDLYDNDWNWIDQQEVHFGNTTIAMSPSVTAANTFTFTYSGLQADIQTIVVGKQYLDNTMSEKAVLKPYTVTNLVLRYDLPLPEKWPDISIMTQVNNIFNARYASNGGNWMCQFTDGHREYSPWYYAQAGVNVHAGITVKF